MTVLNETRQSAAIFSNESRNIVTPIGEAKAGGAWIYNESGYDYDQAADPITGMIVTYDGVGVASVITNEAKNLV